MSSSEDHQAQANDYGHEDQDGDHDDAWEVDGDSMAHAQVDDEVHADERQVALVELNVVDEEEVEQED